MIKILGRPNSSNVQKVMWCIGELGLKHERLDVGGPYGGNDTPEFLAMNPNGLVPVLQEGPVTLWESNTIVRYLGARYGAGTLWPIDSAGRAAAEMWMDWQLSALNPALAPLFMGYVRTPAEQRDLRALETAHKNAVRLLGMLDRHLAQRLFVAGTAFTVGDIPAGVWAYRWYNLPVERPAMPHLEAWYARLQERPAYRVHVMLPLT